MRWMTLVIAAALAAGCATPPGPGTPWQRCELFFGLSVPGGGEVTPAQWQAFVDAEVTPRFPDGLTVVPAAGQWRNAQGRIEREASRMLVLLLPAEDAASARLDAVREAYRRAFRQEAVARACSAAQVAF